MSLNCPQVVSKLKTYQKQHQDLKQLFSDFMSQVPFLPDVKWDEPFMSSPYYKDITNAPKEIFDNLYDAKEEARKKLEELKDEVLPQIEKIINLKEQYNSQVEVLTQSNILEQLSNGEMGIRGVDGKEYPLPTYQEVLGRFTDQEKRTLLEKKVKQGFTKILLVPFAMPLSVLIERYKEVLLKTHKETGIKSTDDPIYVEEGLIQSDQLHNPQNTQMEYGVINYSLKTKKARGGKYKSELLQDPDNAWQINLVEEILDIPAQGQGKTISGRKQIEAGKSSKAFLKLLQTDLQYQGESSQVPEAAILEAVTALNLEHVVIHDFENQGKVNWLISNYLSGGSFVSRIPIISWNGLKNSLYFGLGNMDLKLLSNGFRPTVRF